MYIEKAYFVYCFAVCFSSQPPPNGNGTIRWKQVSGYPNQGFTKEIGNSYTRLPERAKGVVSEPVWNLSQHSAGLAIHFYSNAPQIKVRYTVTGSLNMPHMPSTGVSGVDLYSINSDGEWHFCFGNYSSRIRSPIHIII